MEYRLVATDEHGEPLGAFQAVGPFYIKARAERAAIKESRELSSPHVIIVLETVNTEGTVIHKRGYRMGRLYKL